VERKEIKGGQKHEKPTSVENFTFLFPYTQYPVEIGYLSSFVYFQEDGHTKY